MLASRGTYVYIMESGSIDYQVRWKTSNPCLINNIAKFSVCFRLLDKTKCFRWLETVDWPRLAKRSCLEAMASLWRQVSLIIVMMIVMAVIRVVVMWVLSWIQNVARWIHELVQYCWTCRVPLQGGAEQGHLDDAGVSSFSKKATPQLIYFQTST